MEEIEVLKAKALDDYLAEEKYTQVEDLMTVCAVNIAASATGVMLSAYEVRGTGDKPDLDSIKSDLQIIIKHAAVIAHCLDINVPELEEIEEFFEDELPIESKMDTILSTLSIQHISSSLVAEYFAGEIDEDSPVDLDMMQVGVVDIIANTYAICQRYKFDFTEVVVYG
jgi:hypothetical protein